MASWIADDETDAPAAETAGETLVPETEQTSAEQPETEPSENGDEEGQGEVAPQQVADAGIVVDDDDPIGAGVGGCGHG